ncbi:hypothetical protein [Paracoccus sp. ME4]|uniref:hypothetical protein n=1 Tax=Paracoccus sp. ME4 TaxID=3138066 RepID=UPI00398AABAE
MAALTKNSGRTRVGDGRRFADPLAADVRIFTGALVALNAQGLALPAAPNAARIRGVALHEADNTDGAAGDATVETERGAFLFANDGNVTRAHIGGNVVVVDDNTVAPPPGSGTPLVAGKCLDVTPAGVVVEIL